MPEMVEMLSACFLGALINGRGNQNLPTEVPDYYECGYKVYIGPQRLSASFTLISRFDPS